MNLTYYKYKCPNDTHLFVMIGDTETCVHCYIEDINFDKKADELVEKKYNLRITHNHGDMKWYAYYAGKDQRGLFDDDIDWQTASDTPTEALDKLSKLLKEGKL